jgi:hypothetical protein
MRSRRLVAALAAGCTGAIGAALVGTSRRIRLDGRPGPLQQADAILVFGAAVWPTGPSLSLEVRVARAAEVYSEGWAPVILCSRGASRAMRSSRTTEAPRHARPSAPHVRSTAAGGGASSR